MAIAKSNKNNRKRQILKAKIGFISLCPAGANTIHTMYKSDNGNKNIELQMLSKDMTEQGELTCCVYVPDLEDSQGDQASAAVIKDFAYDFAKNGGNIDIRHNEEALSKDDIFIAETMIIQKGDERFEGMEDYDGNSVDVTGGWGVILKVEDEELRKLYRSGDWGGISMGGMMFARDISDESGILRTLKEIFSPITNLLKQENSDMPLNDKDLKQVAEVVTKTLDARDEATKKKAEEDKVAKEKVDKKNADETKLGLGMEEPVLKANPSEEDIIKHRKNLAIFELSKKVDSKNSSALFEFETRAKEIASSDKLDDVLKNQAGTSYERFYKTNQDNTDVSKGNTGQTDEDTAYADQILKEMDAEEEAEKKRALIQVA